MPALKFAPSDVTKVICGLFSAKPAAVTWNMLTEATGLKREELRGPVATALRHVLRNYGAVYESLRSVGYRRVDDAGLADVGQRAIEKGRRVHRRGSKKLRTVNLDNLSPDERSRHIVRETILGVLTQTASRSTISKAERAAQRAHNQPDAAQLQVNLIKDAIAPRRLRVVQVKPDDGDKAA